MSDNEKWVAALYNCLLLRKPDEVGLQVALDELRRGDPAEKLLTRYLKSEEFAAKIDVFLGQYASPDASRLTKAPGVAICFFGLDRNPVITAETIRTKLTEPILGHYPSVIRVGHFNAPTVVHSPISNENQVKVDGRPGRELSLDMLLAEPQDLNCIRDMLAVIKHFPFRGLGDDDLVLRRNSLWQLYSLQRLESMLSIFGSYDIYCLFRPDILYLDQVDFAECFDQIVYGKYDMVVPAWHLHDGLNDRFAFCNARAFRMYCSRFQTWPHVAEKLGYYHPETILAELALEGGFRVGFTRMRAQRVRASGAIVNEDWKVYGAARASRLTGSNGRRYLEEVQATR